MLREEERSLLQQSKLTFFVIWPWGSGVDRSYPTGLHLACPADRSGLPAPRHSHSPLSWTCIELAPFQATFTGCASALFPALHRLPFAYLTTDSRVSLAFIVEPNHF